MESAITMVQGRAIPLPGNDIDTDRIIPARFMKVVTFDGLGEYAFTDDREQTRAKGQEHSFDRNAHQGASILVANKNFGCGSSREHAPQALKRWGIDAIIGESFAEIFAGNCTSLGIPVATADAETIEKMQAHASQNPSVKWELDVDGSWVQSEDGERWSVTIADGVRSRLLSGEWDSLGGLLANMDQVQTTAQKLPYWNNFA